MVEEEEEEEEEVHLRWRERSVMTVMRCRNEGGIMAAKHYRFAVALWCAMRRVRLLLLLCVVEVCVCDSLCDFDSSRVAANTTTAQTAAAAAAAAGRRVSMTLPACGCHASSSRFFP
jgi:hypothetical protein